MPIRENITYIQTQIDIADNITGNAIFPGTIRDTADYKNGFAYGLAVNDIDEVVGTTSTFTLEFEHGDDPALSDAEPIPPRMMVYGSSNNGVNPYIIGHTGPAPALSGILTQEAFFSTKRYVRTNMVVSHWDGTGTVSGVVLFYIFPAVVPVPQRLGAIS
jgi:hypothetical protein